MSVPVPAAFAVPPMVVNASTTAEKMRSLDFTLPDIE
jgi:hypothetical protein